MDDIAQLLQKRVEEKLVKIAVVGLGYVGLPLALEFVRKGFYVLGLDIDKDRIGHIKNKKSYITDISNEELRQVLATGRFSAGSDFAAIAQAEVVSICVPTPLKKKYQPNISYIITAVRSIAKNIKRPTLIILESTTYPGTTEEVIMPILESSGLRHGRDYFLCFSPERIDPGNKDYPVHKIPKIMGGISKEATELAVLVYKNILDKVVPVSSARVAETAKLLENTFRLINIGLIDELAMMAHKMKIDIWEVIAAASTKPFGFMPFYPGPGVGGHCIPKDPLYLYWQAKNFGFRSRFIKHASDIITRMPEYVVTRVEEALRARGVKLNKARILVSGVTYKKDILDLRKSPSIDILSVLQKRHVKAQYFDPITPYLKVGGLNLKSIDFNKENLKEFDCVIIATDHTNVDYKSILRRARLIFDTRNVYRGIENEKVIKL